MLYWFVCEVDAVSDQFYPLPPTAGPESNGPALIASFMDNTWFQTSSCASARLVFRRTFERVGSKILRSGIMLLITIQLPNSCSCLSRSLASQVQKQASLTGSYIPGARRSSWEVIGVAQGASMNTSSGSSILSGRIEVETGMFCIPVSPSRCARCQGQHPLRRTVHSRSLTMKPVEP